MRPEVSIVIPVLNQEKYLDQCLKSVLNQSFRAIEVICINDGSEDRSDQILDEVMRVDSRVRVFANRRNRGVGESRNQGIKEASGRFVRFVDADDLLPLDSTEILYERAVATGSDLVRGSLGLFQQDDPSKLQSIVAVADRAKTSFRTESSLWIPWWHTSYLISSDLIHTNKLAYPELRRGEDPVFLAHVLVSARHISLVPNIVYLYRRYPKTRGSVASRLAEVEDNLKHAAIVKSLFSAYHPDCWDRGYGPFLLDHFRTFIARRQLDAVHMDFVASEAEKIWGCGVQLTVSD
jgi:glycosyltransferase involved in cell wall biosynthesis